MVLFSLLVVGCAVAYVVYDFENIKAKAIELFGKIKSESQEVEKEVEDEDVTEDAVQDAPVQSEPVQEAAPGTVEAPAEVAPVAADAEVQAQADEQK